MNVRDVLLEEYGSSFEESLENLYHCLFDQEVIEKLPKFECFIVSNEDDKMSVEEKERTLKLIEDINVSMESKELLSNYSILEKENIDLSDFEI